MNDIAIFVTFVFISLAVAILIDRYYIIKGEIEEIYFENEMLLIDVEKMGNEIDVLNKQVQDLSIAIQDIISDIEDDDMEDDKQCH